MRRSRGMQSVHISPASRVRWRRAGADVPAVRQRHQRQGLYRQGDQPEQVLRSVFSVSLFTARRVCVARTMLWQDVCGSVCPSICLSVTRRYFIERAKRIVKLFYHHRHTILLLFTKPKSSGYFPTGTPNGSVECKDVWKNRDFLPISRCVSETVRDTDIVSVEY